MRRPPGLAMFYSACNRDDELALSYQEKGIEVWWVNAA
jgi:hypothetical protein